MPAGNVKITSARRQIPETSTHPNSASRSRLTTTFGSEPADMGDHITGNGRSADGKYSAIWVALRGLPDIARHCA